MYNYYNMYVYVYIFLICLIKFPCVFYALAFKTKLVGFNGDIVLPSHTNREELLQLFKFHFSDKISTIRTTIRAAMSKGNFFVTPLRKENEKNNILLDSNLYSWTDSAVLCNVLHIETLLTK